MLLGRSGLPPATIVQLSTLKQRSALHRAIAKVGRRGAVPPPLAKTECSSAGFASNSRCLLVSKFSNRCSAHHFGDKNAPQEAQLSLTNRATRLEVSQGHQTWYPSICYNVRYGFILVCYSNFVCKTHVFFIEIRLQKCRDLENRIKGP